ncbi:MAG: tRNA (guanosine(46)-N7)-methyltransferase TrmB [Lachnospiraceae bacterium]|nr:tRNA (guanosine(46)-N7)-methyltransferase TrmB [Lachnospiraceae bacterium]
MRLRNIPGAREEIAASPFVIPEDTMREKKGHWDAVFDRAQPLYLEIGMGKGRFITELALRHRDRNYVGIEKYSSVLVRALAKRQQQDNLSNLLFLRMDAEDLTDVFGAGEVAGIYLNFSDPWPKDRHAKRRLPGREFLARYEQILVPGGSVEFKTDNRTLFDFALEEARETGWLISACTFDLHHDPEMAVGNIMTEYEERFSAQGNPICKMILTR